MSSQSLSDHDYELISAYLDGEVKVRQKTVIENRLAQDTQFKLAYEQLSQMRRLMRSQPLLRAPRNYTLSTKMLLVSQTAPRTFLPSPMLLRTLSAFASLVFLVLFGLNWITASRMMSVAPLASNQVLSQPAQPEMFEEPAFQGRSAPGKEQPMAKSMATSVPTLPSISPPSGEMGGMGEAGGAGAEGGVEAPLLEPDIGRGLMAPTVTVSSTITPAHYEITGKDDIQSEPSPSEIPLTESPPFSEVNETEGLIGGIWRNWLFQQILYGVLALSFAFIAIRVGKRKA